MRRRTIDGFNTKRGINQRIPEAGDCSTSAGDEWSGRKPDEREAGGLDQHGQDGDSCAA